MNSSDDHWFCADCRLSSYAFLTWKISQWSKRHKMHNNDNKIQRCLNSIWVISLQISFSSHHWISLSTYIYKRWYHFLVNKGFRNPELFYNVNIVCFYNGVLTRTIKLQQHLIFLTRLWLQHFIQPKTMELPQGCIVMMTCSGELKTFITTFIITLLIYIHANKVNGRWINLLISKRRPCHDCNDHWFYK